MLVVGYCLDIDPLRQQKKKALVVTTEEVEQAVERLNKAGLWASANAHFKEEAEKSGSSRIISGSIQPPEFIDFNGIKLTRSGQQFSIHMEESGRRYKADFMLHQIFVTIRIADSLDDVITALTNYAYLQSKLPQDSISILEAIFRLKQAGLSTHIANEPALEAKDKLHLFTIRWQEAKWSVQVDHAHKLTPIPTATLEEAVNKVIHFYTIA